MNTNDLKKIARDIKSGKQRVLEPKDKFQFKCTACGRCCFNIDVMVGIYDLIRLRNATKLSTEELLRKGFITFYLGDSSGLPVLIINFTKISEGVTRCPFLTPAIPFEEMAKKLKIDITNKKEREALIKKYSKNSKQLFKDLDGVKIDRWLCSIHKNRPIICRLFPLGRFKESKGDFTDFTEKYFLQEKVDWCPGWETKEKQTLKQFLDKADFWQYKEGSDKSHQILDLFLKSGFFASTIQNKKGKTKALFKKDSPVLMFLANLIYNFDSFNYFSKDEKVIKTIYEESRHEDFLYVLKKIDFIVNQFITLFKKQNLKEKDINQFMNNFINKKGGENL